ncbi:STAS domain-containing protein [Actinospica robiniae]|uniref:STAS domain-containing protein n=1 Tax=Actinospica robiniae TaxID=304901 RepID=UPI00042A0624|nr:STAS domain-containing protein [Actinospica robiniae]
MTTPLVVDVAQHQRGPTVITAAGELDLYSARRLETALIPAVEHGIVVLDTAAVVFCDSTGLRALVKAQRAARAASSSLRLAATSEAVTRVLELSGALAYFDLFPDVDAATDEDLAESA